MSIALRKNILKRQKGQGMTEYIIIVALIAIATIGIVTIFGNNLRELFRASADALTGNTNVQVNSTAPGEGDKIVEREGLRDFGENAP